MRRRGLRLMLFLAFLLGAGVAAYQLAALDDARAADGATAEAFERQADTVAAALADVRAAQQAYVATGQNPEFWTRAAESGLEVVRIGVGGLRPIATALRTREAIDQLGQVVADLRQLDGRAREYLASGQQLLASDLVFADGLEMIRAAGRHLADARRAEADARAAALAVLWWQQLYIFVAFVGFAVFVMALLLPAGVPSSIVREQASLGRGAEAHEMPAVAPGDETLGAAIDAGLSQAVVATPEAASRRALDLSEAAALCTELGRVTDTSALPPLLERAVHLLNARGLIVWLADPAGSELLPALAHGYSEQTLAQLGSVKRDADNATAAAYRAGKAQIVPGSEDETGAVVVPLATVSGCVGVMAAEVQHRAAADENVRALASIIAAQLATLVASAPGAPSARAAESG